MNDLIKIKNFSRKIVPYKIPVLAFLMLVHIYYKIELKLEIL